MRHLFSRKNLLRNPEPLPRRNRVLLAFDKFDEGDSRRRSVGLVPRASVSIFRIRRTKRRSRSSGVHRTSPLG